MDLEFNSKTIALYDRVKIQIYEHFQSLNRQSALVRSATNNTERRAALINYQERYSKFFQDINTTAKLKQLERKKAKYLYYYNLNLKKINNEVIVHKITSICRELIENMGITEIEFTKDTVAF